jgi:alpha-tubulin suppressor-like RCC1 family protein
MNSFVLRSVAKSDGIAFTGLTGVAIGSAQICVIEKNQTITCLARGDAPGSPAVVSSSSGVIRDVWQIRIQGKHGCALTQDSGEIYCWGQDSLLQAAAAERALASGSPASGFIQIALDRDRICGIRGSDRVLYCGTFAGPVKVDLQPVNDGSGSAFRKVLMVSGGSEHFCAIQEPGRLICWGSNSSGQIGLKGQKEALTPIQVQFTNPRLVEVVRVSAGGAHTCVATANDPSLFCFGESFFGGSHSVDPVEYPL